MPSSQSCRTRLRMSDIGPEVERVEVLPEPMPVWVPELVPVEPDLVPA